MKKVNDLSILFLDLNSYFASVEQQLNPALRGQPVIVTPGDTDATCAIAASYEAKAHGVKTGTPVWRAKQMIPGLKIVTARHDHYVEFHHIIMDEINRHLPIEQICSIDEVACRIPKRWREEDQLRKLVTEIKQGIRESAGEAIGCSVGIAPNRLLAKIASEMEKPDGFTILHPEALPDSLFHLALNDIPGIGAAMEKRLNRAGIWSISDFCSLEPKQARQVWRSIGGERYWYRLHGYEIPTKPTKKSVIGHSHVLAPDLRPQKNARLVARRLCNKAAARMRRNGYHTEKARLSIRFVSGQKWSRDLSLRITDDSFCLLAAIDALWRQMVKQIGDGVNIKKVGVSFSRLKPCAQVTGDLFEAAARSHPSTLSNTVDTVNQAFGRDSLFIGPLPGMAEENSKRAQSGEKQRMSAASMGRYSGTKIAFNRIPDRAEFAE